MSTMYLRWALVNLGFVMFLLATAISLLHKIACPRISISEIVYRWFALFPLGITALYAFIMHAFYPVYTAALMGWLNSPFQFQVAAANLGYGMIAILSFKARFPFRLATVIGNACWLWGDATGHLNQIMLKHDFDISNAGSWLWFDIFIPVILLLCLVGIKKNERF